MNWDSWEDPKNSFTAAVTGLILIRDWGEIPSISCVVIRLPHHTLQSGETDAVLVLQQLAHRADTAVAQMVDIIVVADAVLQMHVIVDGSKNIFLGNMLGNQVVDIPADRRLRYPLSSRLLLQNLSQHRIVYQFRNAQLPWDQQST